MLSLHNILLAYFCINAFLGGMQLNTGIKMKRTKTALVLVFIMNLFFALPLAIVLFCAGVVAGVRHQLAIERNRKMAIERNRKDLGHIGQIRGRRK